ncbi:DNA-directed primase/polymerase protein [Clonorchis sinensis]|uniref:DNA-directed primase/polymerase protein n=1 Tax=Clonorchis sinensis TaxID=79923 RepID=A0A8T1M666_CLOSI|nr:DNA-directed primase/polymerase protein [Clonorchis sinensis]
MFDRRLKLEAAAVKVREIPQPYRASLTGPTAVRKVFHKQEDALNFARYFGPEMMVFSYESHSLGHEGQRFFLASGIQSFFHYYRQMTPSARLHYEVIPTFRPAKLYLDLEFSRQSNPGKDGPGATKIFIKALCSVLKHFYKSEFDPEQIILLDASTEKKFSQHAVFNSPEAVFENNLEQGQLIQLLCSALWLLSSSGSSAYEAIMRRQCSKCASTVDRLATSILPDAGIGPTDARQCLVHPPVLPTSDDASPLVSICDTGVYTRNRNFRLAGSRKLTGTSALWPVNATATCAFDLVWTSWKQWAHTLVTFVCYPTKAQLLKRPVADCSCVSSVNIAHASFRRHSCEVEKRAIPSCEPVHLSDDLRQFIQTVLTDWCQKDLSYAARDRVLSTRWKIHGFDDQHFTVTTDELRFCERVGRAHRSNHVIIVFDLLQRFYYQKCLDPDCRALDFRSQTWPIPNALCSRPQQGNNVAQANDDTLSFSEPSVTDDDQLLCGVMDTMDVSFSEDF